MPPAVTASAPASGTRTPAWLMTWRAEVDADGEGRGHGQERQAALERAGAEHVLHVERAEQERAEQHGRDGEHHQRPAADAAIGEALHREQRLRRAQLERGERGQAHERRGTEAERLRRRPARAVGLRGGEHECAEARGREQRAAEVEAAPPGAQRVGRARSCSAPAASTSPTGRLMRKIRRQSTSSVSVPPSSTPNAAPAPPTAPQAPSALARSPPCVNAAMMIESAAGESIAAPRPWPARAANSVGGAAGERRGERGEREHAQAGEEHAPAPEQVGGAPAEQEQAAEDQRVARDRPADVAAADVEVLRHVGKRDVHGGDVEDDHQLGDAEQDEQAVRDRLAAVLRRTGGGGGASGGLQTLNQTVMSGL